MCGAWALSCWKEKPARSREALLETGKKGGTGDDWLGVIENFLEHIAQEAILEQLYMQGV